ncbi:outer membrane protein assembly factor BamE [Pseudorhodobacter ferrugineus]|uniref:outer membrane protein assembly factor BamE n=1 Tax=Pseudorhodobacter ferrugineus TaxID=77008 RepID=UPI0003B37F64|nr:outer membrane protein assembly factor BamE [Pseudorhodobacter ferrugineus]
MQVQAGNIRARMAQMAMAGCILLMAGCSAIYRNHGYVPADDDLAVIQVGVSTQQDVADVIGRPSAAALLNDNGWYYVQSKFKQVGPRKPEEIDRQVVAISFTDAGIVENVERFGLAEGRVVPLSRRVTDTNIKSISFLTQLFSNFGRLRAGDIVGQ